MLVVQLPVGLNERVEKNVENCYQMFERMNGPNLEEGRVSGVSSLTSWGR